MTHGWAIKHWRGQFYIDTASRTRAEAIAVFRRLYGVSEKVWKDDSKHRIHHAAKIEMTERR